MKYLSMSTLAIVFVLSVSTFSFAALEDESSGTLVLGANHTDTSTVSVPLSPGVTAGYQVGDAVGTLDWFVCGAYHSAGSKVYATASSISQLWEASASADNPLEDTFGTIPNTYATAGSDDLWSSDAGWE